MVAMLLAALAVIAPAEAAPVGCHAPAPPDRRYYLDAIHGNDAADGVSPATAWRSLARALRRGLGAPDLSGAEIVLADGDYGPLAVAMHRDAAPPRADGTVPYLSFVAARGAHPAIASVAIIGAERVQIAGLRIASQSGFLKFRSLVQVTGTAGRPSRDIRIVGNELTSGGDYRAWSQDEWLERVTRGGINIVGYPGASVRCVVAARNHIHGVGFGAMLAADDIAFTGNTIEDFGLDGIDVAGNRIDIVGNRISDNLTLPVANHNDMIQGLLGPEDKAGGVTVWHDVHILGNLLLRQTRPDLRFAGAVQGIDGFAGVWEGLLVANNAVVIGGPRRLAGTVFYSLAAQGDPPFSVLRPCTPETLWGRRPADPGVNAGNVRSVPVDRLGWVTTCSTHAITFGEVRHGAIVNNTLMTDNPAMDMVGVWIKPRSPGHNGTCDTIIANNLGNWSDLGAIAATLVARPPASAAERAAACTPGRVRNYAAGNLDLHATRRGGIDPGTVFRNFVGYHDPGGRTFGWDLHLRPGSPAIGGGNAAMARAALGPLAARDIEGRARTRSDIGAYAF